MKESNYITLLKTFSKTELKKFERFLRSPYHNKERNFIPFFNLVKKYHPAYPPGSLSEKEIFAKLYPDKTFDEKRSSITVRVLCSQFLQMIEEFLEIEYFKGNTAFRHCAALTQLLNRRLFNRFENKYKNISKVYNNVYDDAYNFQDVFLIENVNKSFYYIKENNHKDVIAYRDSQSKIIKTLTYKLIQQLIGYEESYLTNYIKEYKKNSFVLHLIEKLNIPELIEKVEDTDAEVKEKLQMIYFSHILDTNRTDKETYLKFKNLFLKKYDKLSFDTVMGFTLTLMNFCLYELMKDRNYFMKEYTEWNNLLSDRSIAENRFDLFNIRLFRNLVRDLAMNDKFDEIKSYVKDYIRYYDTEIRDNCSIYAEGLINFYRKDYINALINFNNCTFKIQMMIRDTKYYKLLSCTALGYYEQALNELDSLKHFLKNSTSVPADFLRVDKNVLNYYSSYIKYKADKNSTKLEQLMDEIIGLDTHNIHLLWLLKHENSAEFAKKKLV